MSLLDVTPPGPRPLTEQDLLLGRSKALKDLQDACGSRDIITLTAWSGVGKTSFIQAGLIPNLLRSGYYKVFPQHLDDGRPRGWAAILATLRHALPTDSIEQTAENVYRLLVGLELDSSRDLVDDLDELLDGERAVVVLDQFEELLRSHGALGEELLRLVARVAPDVGAHIIIARSEYRERLRPVEEALAVSVRTMTLPEIGAGSLPEIFAVPFKDVRIEDGITDRLVSWWLDARAETGAARLRQVGSEGLADIGLLQFQATSRAFVEWIKANWDGRLRDEGHDEHRLTLALLDAYVLERAKEREQARAAAGVPDPKRFEAESGGGGWLFQDSLVTYVREQMTSLMLDELSRPPGPDGVVASDEPLWWKQGPLLMAARCATAFTVAGFKQPQALYSLLSRALEAEFGVNAATQLGEAIQETPDEIEALLATAGQSVRPAGIAIVLGKSGAEVVAEMVDCLHATLRQLSSAEVNILRQLDRDGEPVFELVHDGMGEALKAWSKSYLDQPLAIFGVIGGQTGAFIAGRAIEPSMIGAAGHQLTMWGAVDRAAHEGHVAASTGSHLVITGLVFPSAAIKDCSFRDVTLRGCDFAGASFINCRFENVVFEDCILRALLFLGFPSDTGESVLENVTFRNTPDAAKDETLRGNLDLLTFKRPQAAGPVTFEGIQHATGVFLQDLPSSSWTLDASRIDHLVISTQPGLEGDDRPRVTLNNDSEAWAVTTRGPNPKFLDLAGGLRRAEVGPID